MAFSLNVGTRLVFIYFWPCGVPVHSKEFCYTESPRYIKRIKKTFTCVKHTKLLDILFLQEGDQCFSNIRS